MIHFAAKFNQMHLIIQPLLVQLSSFMKTKSNSFFWILNDIRDQIYTVRRIRYVAIMNGLARLNFHTQL